MKSKQRHQLKFRIDPADAQRLKTYCSARNITETAAFRAALQQYLAGTTEQDVLYRRLDRISRELARAAAGLELLGETFGTFVQFWLAHNPEIDGQDKPAVQRDVARRYRRFVSFVMHAVRDERSTLLFRLLGPRVDVADDGELDRVRTDVGASHLPDAAAGGV